MAKLIDHQSAASTKTELDLFTVPPTQVSIESSFWQAIRLVNNCNSTGPYKFHIDSNPHWTDLNRNYIYAKFQITQTNGGALPNDIDVAPINLLAQTFFRQLKVYLNSKLVYDSGDNYAYRSFLETELNFDRSIKESLLQASIYVKDAPSIDQNYEHGSESPTNVGHLARKKLFRTTGAGTAEDPTIPHAVEVMAPLH